MRSLPEQFKLELVIRPNEQPNARRKMSADGRRSDRREKEGRGHSQPREQMPVQSSERQKTPSNCLDTIFHKGKDRQCKEFSAKCINFLSKKKLPSSDESEPKRNTFSTMLQNIKNVIKDNERRERESKDDSPPSLQNRDFQCVRSQIHQIYTNEDRVELYRMIRSNESRNSSRNSKSEKEKQKQKAETAYVNAMNTNNAQMNRLLMNPFLKFNTVVCFTMALNEPQNIKKPLFEAPTYRTPSSLGKRVVQISKPVQPKSMSFQLNGQYDSQYMKKLKSFLDFIFKVNYSNSIYVALDLSKPDEIVSSKYKVYIGKGNNSLLIKSLMKRRFWWEIADSIDSPDIDFFWSQNILDRVHNSQKCAPRQFSAHDKTIKKQKGLEETFDLNRKILPLDKSYSVEKYILKDGYSIPFEEIYTPDILSNHLPRNYCIGSKKSLFKSLFHYFTEIKHKNPFDYIPKTYHILSLQDQQYKIFVKENQSEPDRVWIVKPGQNTNRGNGIKLATFSSISQLLRKSKHENGQPFTYIVQSYINRPFLYANRKFDIRHYIMMTSVNGIVKAYWYRQGYIRTSSELFDLEDLDNVFIHLTNDAIQRNSEDYEKYEPANKLSYTEFQRYLDYTYPAKCYNFQRDIIPKMKEMAAAIIKANYLIIDHRRHANNFQIFGLDFMIDRDFKPWLIEVNYNPCLEVNCPLLERIIPPMVQNSFRIGLDPLFPPTAHFPASRRFYLSDHYLKNLRYQLIFDESSLRAPIHNDYGFIDSKQEQQQYVDEGQELQELLDCLP